MKFKDADLLLRRLKKGEVISAKKEPANIGFLRERELVEVQNRKVVLTQKGNLAVEMGIREYIDYHNTEKEILNFSREKSRKISIILMLAFFLFFTLFVAAISTNLSFLRIF